MNTLNPLSKKYRAVQASMRNVGTVGSVGKRLNIPRSTLYQKLKTYGPELSRF